MTEQVILEIAVESVTAAQAAERAGADRIELCVDLRNGGITPSAEMMQLARKELKIPIFAIIRPRTGDFVYCAEEMETMRKSITLARESGMDGVVLGALLSDATIDVPRAKELVELARPMPVTFHRAFDECNDLLASLEDVVATGAARVLTSGGAPNALEGMKKLRELVVAAGQRITILPGGGIRPGNFRQVLQGTGAKEMHSGLGTVLPYGTEKVADFEEEVRKLVKEKY
jgi:copper homeostasis protein